MSPQHRGSGTKTAIIALFLAWLHKSEPQKAMIVAANLFGSDTDTIATMAGSILGAITSEPPTGKINDKEYIVEEASRLYSISCGKQTESFAYPDLLKWNPPDTQSDYVGTINSKFALSGLGFVKEAGNTYEQRGKYVTIWRWLQLNFGQKILAKQRLNASKIPITNMPVHIKNEIDRTRKETDQRKLFEKVIDIKEQSNTHVNNKMSLNNATKKAIDSGFDPSVIGNLIIELSKQNNGIELVIGFSSIIAKAIKTRVERENRK